MRVIITNGTALDGRRGRYVGNPQKRDPDDREREGVSVIVVDGRGPMVFRDSDFEVIAEDAA